jgi:tetratricopeptide (TPR) repeat protein
MLNNTLPKDQSDVLVPDQPHRTVLIDEDVNPLSLILPPIEDIQAITHLRESDRSLSERQPRIDEHNRVAFQFEFEKELQKAERFADSPVYFNKLASLARAAGNSEEEFKHVAKARELSKEAFFEHRYGDTLIADNRESDAERLFRSLAAKDDLYALLKVAALHVRRSEIVEARSLVDRAIGIDPIDFSARLFDGGLALIAAEYSRAIHSFRMALEERPTSSVVFENMATAYLRMRQSEKAFAALKRAVALNPLNASALFVLADEAFRQNRDDDVINSLRIYVELDARNPDAWARLARACMKILDYEGAITALRREGSIRDSSSVWNNLGAVRATQGIRLKALECFHHAVEKATGAHDRDAQVAARNIAQLISSLRKPRILLSYTSKLIRSDVNNDFLRDIQLSDVYAFHIDALRAENREAELLRLSTAILEGTSAAWTIRHWVLSTLIAHYSMQSDEGIQKAVAALKKWLPQISKELDTRTLGDPMLINNVAFVLAESGDTVAASEYMSRVQVLVHRDPYVTATHGLLVLRKGDILRGTALYREAIGLMRLPLERAKLRQKLFLELGKYFAPSDTRKALVYYNRVIKTPGADNYLVDQARRLARHINGHQ